MPQPKVSVIVPAYNEVENIEPLAAALKAGLDRRYEVILVDDGSTDGTAERAQRIKNPPWRVLRHRRNLGKTHALITGARAAHGTYLVFFDADLQFAVADIPRLVAELDVGADVSTGWKTGPYEKRFVSSIYNWLARLLFALPVHDINAVKALRRDVFLDLDLRPDWHRYIVPLAHARGYRVTETRVQLAPRRFGRSKYQGSFRIVVGFFDLMAVAFQLSFLRKPLLYFGTLGMATLLLGFVAGVVAIILRLLGHGFRPLLYLVLLLVLVGLVIFVLGFLAEAISGLGDRIARIEQKLR